MPSIRELAEAHEEWNGYYANAKTKRLSRRRVLRASTALGLLSAGGMSALIGCSSSDEEATAVAGGGTPATSAGGSGGSVASAPVTGPWDTTKMPPYPQGLDDAAANPPAQWQPYPWFYKYGPWRYNWDKPMTRGGQYIDPSGTYTNFDVMVSGLAGLQPYSRLYSDAMREGVDLTGHHIEPDLAISAEHAPDYTSWTFKIAPDVKYQNIAPLNGRALTASDIEFSVMRVLDTSVNRAVLKEVEKVTAIDDVTIRFDLKRPQLDFEATLASPQVPIFAPEAFENQDQFKAQPVGTGPFQVDFHEYQNRTDYIRHPAYWQTPPYKPEKYGQVLPFLDKYTRQYFANAVTAKEAFINGKVDTFQPGCGLDTAIVKEQLDAVPNAIVMTNAYWANSPMGIRFQYKNPLLQDIRVRQALSMSINREQVWSGGMDSTGLIDASPIPLVYQDLDSPVDLSTYGPSAQYNPQRARELLIEAGLTPPIKLQIFQTAPQPAAWQGALDTVVFNWKEAGIVDAELVVRDGQVFQQDMVNHSFPELAFVGGGGLIFGYTLSSSVTPAFLTGSPANYGELSDPALDDLLERYAVATDPAGAADLARQISRQIVDNVDHLWFGEIEGIEVAQPWLNGMVVCEHSCVHFIGGANIKYVWIGADAPEGRGGKPI